MAPADSVAGTTKEAPGRRYLAFVVGNNAYKEDPLTKCIADATDVSSLLQASGYEVTVLVDATKPALREALLLFTDEVSKITPPTPCTVLVYFSGHGAERGGENFLVPVDGSVKSLAGAPWGARGVGNAGGGYYCTWVCQCQ